MQPKKPIKFVASILKAAGRDDYPPAVSLGEFQALDHATTVGGTVKQLVLGHRPLGDVDLDGRVEIRRVSDGSLFAESPEVVGAYLTSEEAAPYSRSSAK